MKAILGEITRMEDNLSKPRGKKRIERLKNQAKQRKAAAAKQNSQVKTE